MENQLEEKKKQKHNSAKKFHIPGLLSKEFITPVGSKIQVTYELQYDEKRRCELVVPVGEEDIDKFIQASASSTDMAFLVREAQRTGQYPIDARAQYGVDMTLMPNNIHELYNTTAHINDAFEKLGEQGKQAFGSVDNYKEAIINGTAEKILYAHYKKLADLEIEKAKKTEKDGDK